MFPHRHPPTDRREHARRMARLAMALGIAAAVLALGFLTLSRAVVRGATEDIDRRLLLAMRTASDLSDPIGPPWVEEVSRDVTALGSTVVLTLIAVTATLFFWLASMHRGAVYIALACFGAMVVSTILKQTFDRPRPDLVPHGARVYTASFPSGHSTMAAAIYLTLGMVASRFVSRRRVKALLMFTAVLVTAGVGASRVFLGVHWPSDVLAGWTVGAAWALMCWSLAVWLQDHGVIEGEDEGSVADDQGSAPA